MRKLPVLIAIPVFAAALAARPAWPSVVPLLPAAGEHLVRVSEVTPKGCLLLVLVPAPSPSTSATATPPSPSPAPPGASPSPTRFAAPPICAPAEAAPPSTAPSPPPSSTPAPATLPTTSPAAAATPDYALPPDIMRIAAANDPPRIFRVELSSVVVRSGQTVVGRVTTTTNVASVVGHLQGYELPLSRLDAGVFGLTYGVPSIPFFLKRTYKIDVVATTPTGAAFSVEVPLTIR